MARRLEALLGGCLARHDRVRRSGASGTRGRAGGDGPRPYPPHPM